MKKSLMFFSIAFCVLLTVNTVLAEEKKDNLLDSLIKNARINGFIEARSGYRVVDDDTQKDKSLMELRYQFDISSRNELFDLALKGDVYGDNVQEEGVFDTREAYVLLYPADFLDLKIGRQIITWGTGDLIFINDLFPKDWVSFFIGRDSEYLKAPSDALRASMYFDDFNVDLVYTPQFDSDRYISGRRVSYFNTFMDSLAGRDARISTDKPDDWFRDDEIAMRVYRYINNYEVSMYAYKGFWKSPAGFNNSLSKATFPDLQVYGASVRGTVGEGIGNAELGYYLSEDDTSGDNALVNNSELRFLLGYTQEIGRNFTAGLQYYLEYMTDYEDFKESGASGTTSLPRDRDRHLTTLRLTKLLMNQNLTLSLFTFYSPSDEDVYMRPSFNYKVTDRLMVEAGGNVFFGDHKDTFFGQFQDNTNIYAAVRYSF